MATPSFAAFKVAMSHPWHDAPIARDTAATVCANMLAAINVHKGPRDFALLTAVAVDAPSLVVIRAREINSFVLLTVAVNDANSMGATNQPLEDQVCVPPTEVAVVVPSTVVINLPNRQLSTASSMAAGRNVLRMGARRLREDELNTALR